MDAYIYNLFGVTKQAYHQYHSTVMERLAKERFVIEFIKKIRQINKGLGGLKLWLMYKEELADEILFCFCKKISYVWWRKGEVVVDNKEPEWIRPFFYRFIDEKANLYKPMPNTLTYIYSIYNLSDNNGYWFENNGQMAIPSSKEKEGRYFILPEEGIIHYKNKTAGCDFTNMKRMIYHDFVDEIDKKYIMRHLFMINHAYKNGNKDVVQIFFKSKKYDTDDKGYITIDTAKCVVLSVKRKTGFKYNLKNKTNSFMRNTFRSVRGFKYTNWLVNFDVHYQQLNGSFYPAVYHYKVYIASTSSKGKDKRTLFESSESEIKLQQPQQQPKGTYIELPRPWYMKIIVTKKERLKEEKLQKIPKKHIVY